MKQTLALLIGLALAASANSLNAQNTVVTYQGRITDNGTNFNGIGQFKFALVTSTNNNHPAIPGGVWIIGDTIVDFSLLDGGNGYLVPPAVTVTGGGGSGAVATANISGGVVTGLTLVSGGSGYVSQPTITISPPPENITLITHWSNDGTSSAGSEPAANVGVPVANGLFTVGLGDISLTNMAALSAALFQRPNLQLRIWFNDGANGFAALSPLQNLTAAPYAASAHTANSLATAGSQPVNLTVNGANVMRIESVYDSGSASFTVNSLGGYAGNVISNGFVGGFIGGGGNSTSPNRLGANYASVLGGLGNTASGLASTAMGELARASGQFGAIAMGFATTASGNYGAIAMGVDTTASGNASTAMGSGTTASGAQATAMGDQTSASGVSSTAMGAFTIASGVSSTSMGLGTTASGTHSTAMGYRAKALHADTVVWADGQGADFASTGVNQFCIRASGGVQLNTDTSVFFGNQTRQMLNLFGTDYGIGVQGATEYFRTASEFNWFKGGVHDDTAGSAGTGGIRLMNLNSVGLSVNGTFVSTSDRNVKENFTSVDPRELLEKVAALPLSEWNYKQDPDTRHIGPMAQDFYAAFKVGPDDKHITTVDADGVALAAIQGLNQKLEAENAALKARVERLERLFQQLPK